MQSYLAAGCVLLLGSVAIADPVDPSTPRASIGVTQAVSLELVAAFQNITTLQVGIPLRNHLWLDTALGFGKLEIIDVDESQQRSTPRAYELRGGVGGLYWNDDSCVGYIASLGLQRQTSDQTYQDEDEPPSEFTTLRMIGFLELRGLLRIRLGYHVALEVSAGIRAHLPIYTQHDISTSLLLGGVAAVGIHAAL